MWLVLAPGGYCSFTSETLGLGAFLSVEKSCPSFPGVHGLNWDSTSKSAISNDFPWIKAAITDSSGWLWPPEGQLSPAF